MNTLPNKDAICCVKWEHVFQLMMDPEESVVVPEEERHLHGVEEMPQLVIANNPIHLPIINHIIPTHMIYLILLIIPKPDHFHIRSKRTRECRMMHIRDAFLSTELSHNGCNHGVIHMAHTWKQMMFNLVIDSAEKASPHPTPI